MTYSIRDSRPPREFTKLRDEPLQTRDDSRMNQSTGAPSFALLQTVEYERSRPAYSRPESTLNRTPSKVISVFICLVDFLRRFPFLSPVRALRMSRSRTIAASATEVERGTAQYGLTTFPEFPSAQAAATFITGSIPLHSPPNSLSVSCMAPLHSIRWQAKVQRMSICHCRGSFILARERVSNYAPPPTTPSTSFNMRE